MASQQGQVPCCPFCQENVRQRRIFKPEIMENIMNVTPKAKSIETLNDLRVQFITRKLVRGWYFSLMKNSRLCVAGRSIQHKR
jgi:hypothetical protein